MSTRNVTENIADHIAIGHLLNQYTNSLNTSDWVVLSRLFVDDATWRVITDGEIEFEQAGGQNIVSFLRDSTATSERFVQMNHAPVIQVDGDHATASSTMEAVYWLADGTRQQRFAIYHDEVTREGDGEWRFTVREFRSIAIVTVPPNS